MVQCISVSGADAPFCEMCAVPSAEKYAGLLFSWQA
jgi:hypothetical protein